MRMTCKKNHRQILHVADIIFVNMIVSMPFVIKFTLSNACTEQKYAILVTCNSHFHDHKIEKMTEPKIFLRCIAN